MTTAVEPKKLAILVALLVVAALTLYFNVFSGDSSGPAASAPVAPQAQVYLPASPRPTERRRAEASAGGEFKPRQGPANPQDRPDPATIDPTLRLDLLAKVRRSNRTPRFAISFSTARRRLCQPWASPSSCRKIRRRLR